MDTSLVRARSQSEHQGQDPGMHMYTCQQVPTLLIIISPSNMEGAVAVASLVAIEPYNINNLVDLLFPFITK